MPTVGSEKTLDIARRSSSFPKDDLAQTLI